MSKPHCFELSRCSQPQLGGPLCRRSSTSQQKSTRPPPTFFAVIGGTLGRGVSRYKRASGSDSSQRQAAFVLATGKRKATLTAPSSSARSTISRAMAYGGFVTTLKGGGMSARSIRKSRPVEISDAAYLSPAAHADSTIVPVPEHGSQTGSGNVSTANKRSLH